MKILNEERLTEMPRGPQKSLTKAKAYEIAKEVLQNHMGVAYYSISEGMDNPEEKYNLSEEEVEKVQLALRDLAEKMCKRIGIDYITY